MDIRELYTKICEFPELETLELAKELAGLQFEFIVYLLEQKEETFEAYSRLEKQYSTVKDSLHKEVARNHPADKLVN